MIRSPVRLRAVTPVLPSPGQMQRCREQLASHPLTELLKVFTMRAIRSMSYTAVLLSLLGALYSTSWPATAEANAAVTRPSSTGSESHPESACTVALGPNEVAGCAIAASLAVQLARGELAVLAGRRMSAGTLLPAHPVLQFSASARIPPAGQNPPTGSGPVLNWSVLLSQELEIAGQRGTRLAEVDAEVTAQLRRVAVARQESAAAALVAYYDAVAAQEELALARDAAQVTYKLAFAAAARAHELLLAPVDADVARAEAAHFGVMRYEAERRAAATQAVLASLLGLGAAPPLTGTLDPTLEQLGPVTEDESLVTQALALRGEIAAAETEQQVLRARIAMLRRARIPNLTLSVFAQRDGFDEQVFGGGLALPLVLPGPLGPSRRGEIAAAQAQTAQAARTVEYLRRKVRMEVQRAIANERGYAAELQLFPSELLDRAHADLLAIEQALAAQRLPIREALLSQRSLIELRHAHVQARLGYALSQIERRRASGQPLSAPGPRQ